MTPLLTTGRRELRLFQPQDAAQLHEIFGDPDTQAGTGRPALAPPA